MGPVGILTTVVRGVPRGVRGRAKAALRSGITVVGGARALPGFLIVGAQRGGTTSLYAYLRRHPDVAGALLEKEVHFFDLHFDRGEGWYRRFFPTEAACARHRRRRGRQLLVGEASPYYLFHPLVPERVARALPGARLIAMLRDPVERAYSQWRHEVELGHETLPFEEAVAREPERTAGEAERLASDPTHVSFAHQHFTYVARGEYTDQLQRWFGRFPPEQMLVIGSEEFFDDPSRELGRAHAFLRLEPHELPRYDTFNATATRGLDPSLRERLAAHFRPHNERLFELLGRRFDWS